MTAVLIVDQYRLYHEALENNKKLDPRQYAGQLKQMAKVLGNGCTPIALVSDQDEDGVIAYGETGYEMRRMPSNRGREVRDFLLRMGDQITAAPPRYLLVVTSDEDFLILFHRVQNIPNFEIRIWAPRATAPTAFTGEPAYHYCALEEVIQEIKTPKAGIYLDYENVHFGLQARGATTDPKEIIGVTKRVVENAKLGDLVSIIAYADWDEINRSAGRNIQRMLASELNVDVRYTYGEHGKNSADMKIAGDVRTLLEQPSTSNGGVDNVLLVTNDRDYADLIERSKPLTKKVSVLGFRDGISKTLRRLVDEKDMFYFEDYLSFRKEKSPQVGHPVDWDDAIRFALGTVQYFFQNRYWYAHTDKLAEALGIDLNGASLKAALEQEVILPHGQETLGNGIPATVKLNKDHPTVQVAQRWPGWIKGRLDHLLNVKKMPYVDTNYLFHGVTRDQKFAELGMGKTRQEVEALLSLTEELGMVKSKAVPNPKDPTRYVTAWWLPEVLESRGAAEEPAAPEAYSDSEQPIPIPEALFRGRQLPVDQERPPQIEWLAAVPAGQQT